MKILLISAIAIGLLVSCNKSDTSTPTPVPTPTPTPVPVTPTVTAYIPDGWKALSAFTSPRVCAVAVASSDKLYVGLGYDATSGSYQSSVSSDWNEYDPATAKWTKKADFPGLGRANAISFVIGGKIYVGLGSNYDANTKGATYVDFYEYDPATDKWTEKSSFRGGGRDQPVSFVIGNKGYVGTGNTDPFSAATVTNDFYEYDPATDKWTQKTSLTGTARCRAFGFALNGKGYLGAGEDRNVSKLSDFYEYDPTADKWAKKADFPEANARARGFDFGAVGMVAGGRAGNSNSLSNTVYQYNPAENTWAKKSDLASDDDTRKGRFYPIALTLKSKAYIGLGGFATGQKDFYEYVPK